MCFIINNLNARQNRNSQHFLSNVKQKKILPYTYGATILRTEMSICGASEQLKNKAAQVCNVGREVIDLMS